MTRISLVVLLLASLSLTGQTFISAKAGMVNYEEGVRAMSPRQLQEGEVFSSPNRSEILMMPGTFLRLERSAEVRMLATSVTHPAVELLGGLASLEVNEMPKESELSISWGDYRDDRAIRVAHKGLFRFEVSQDGSALKVMVQNGQVHVPGLNGTLRDGQEVVLTAANVSGTAKFDRKFRDDFDLWAGGRAEMLGMASYRTARSVGSGYLPSSGVWAFSPFYGMFTFMPCGSYMSPWGYFYYYGPRDVYNYYPPVYYSGGGTGSLPVRAFSGNSHSGPVAPRLPVYSGGNNSDFGRGSSADFGGMSPRTSAGGGFSGSIGSSPSTGGGTMSGTPVSSPATGGARPRQ